MGIICTQLPVEKLGIAVRLKIGVRGGVVLGGEDGVGEKTTAKKNISL